MIYLNYKTVEGTQPEEPSTIDTTSSPTTVYLRKDIRRESKEIDGEVYEYWLYEEAQLTPEQYQEYLAEQQFADSVAGKVQNKRESEIIDEYTLKLLEEGVI